MSSADPDGSHFIHLVCLVTFISLPFAFCCQFLPWSALTGDFNVGGGGGEKLGRLFQQISNETVKSVCVYYYLVFLYFLY